MSGIFDDSSDDDSHSSGQTHNSTQGDPIECPVCMNDLEDPKVLQCGHNLCPECVDRVAESVPTKRRRTTGTVTASTSSTARQIKCPLCKFVTVIPEGGLRTNYGMKDSILREIQLRKEKKELETRLAEKENAESDAPSEQCSGCEKQSDLKEMFICLSSACQGGKEKNGATQYFNPGNKLFAFAFDNGSNGVPNGAGKLCGACMYRHHRQCDSVEAARVASGMEIDAASAAITHLHAEMERIQREINRQAKNPIEHYLKQLLLERKRQVEESRSSICSSGAKTYTKFLLRDHLNEELQLAKDVAENFIKFYDERFQQVANALGKQIIERLRDEIKEFSEIVVEKKEPPSDFQ